MTINKGKISNILDGGNAVTVTPYQGGTVTPKLAVPFFLIGFLPIGTAVAYLLFDDGTGIILSRMDGAGSIPTANSETLNENGGDS